MDPLQTPVSPSAVFLALLNIEYFVADYNLFIQLLLIGLLVLKNLLVDKKTMLEEHLELLNGSDFAKGK